MKKKMIKKIFQGLIFFLALVLIGSAGIAKASFGITPPYVINDKLTQGSSFEQSILIIRDDPVTSIKAKATINVPGADNWITIDKGLSFDLPKGQKITPIVVKISVPNDAAFKEYQGKIDIMTEPNTLQQGLVNIGLGGQVKVDFTVVNEKINSFVVDSVKTIDLKEGDNINVIVAITNKGNIATTPSKAVLDIYSNDKKNIIATKENINSPEQIKQFSSGNVTLEFDGSDVKMGNYWGKVKIYNGSELIFEGEVVLNVLEKSKTNNLSASNGWADKLLVKIGLGGIDKNITCLVLALLALAIVLLILRSIRKKNKKRIRK